MPHRKFNNRVEGFPITNECKSKKTTISQYLQNLMCISCGKACNRGICETCYEIPTKTLVTLHEKCRQYERNWSNIEMVKSRILFKKLKL